MKLHPKQSEFVSSTKRYKLLNWGRRTGKTFCLGYDFYADLWNKDAARVAYYAPTRDDARDISWDTFKEVYGNTIVSVNETLLEIVVANKHYGEVGAKGTSLLKLYGWEAVKNSEKGRGVENDVVALDECAKYQNFWQLWREVIEPTLLTSEGRAVFTSTPKGFNHFHELSERAQADDNWFYSHATSYDNPHNSRETLDRLKSEMPESSFAQEYMSDFRSVQGKIYKGWQEIDEIPHEARRIGRGLDFGYSNDPTACVDIYTYNGGYILDEVLYRKGMLNDEIANVLKAEDIFTVADSASPKDIAELKRYGLTIIGVDKKAPKVHPRQDVTPAGMKKTSVTWGVGLVQQQRISVTKRSTNILREYRNYLWATDKEGKILNEPEHEYSHSMDAIRYFFMRYLAKSEENHSDYYDEMNYLPKRGGVRV